MKVIKENVFNKLEVNKSIFYTDLIKVYSKDEVVNKFNKIKEKYKDATHYCYAYIIDDIKKSSDDGEPGGTAGVPIMETLNNKDLNYVLCVVTRYFGGIKLGAGGLVRAYTKSITETLKISEFVELVKGIKIYLCSFQCDRRAEDYAEANPHFTFHVQALYNNVLYDPSYGMTGMATFKEMTPVTANHSKMPRFQFHLNLPIYEHTVDWVCPH